MLRRSIVILLLLVIPARANLGEDVAACIKRYGKPMGFTEAKATNPFGTIVFMAGPYQLIIFLSNNVEVGARVTKKDKTDFSPAEMKDIMNADASSPWIATASSDPNSLQWVRADKATATYDKDKKMLIFTSPQMAAALHPEPVETPAPAPALSAHLPPGNFAPGPAFPEALAEPPPTNAAPAP